jgi:YfiH family protein
VNRPERATPSTGHATLSRPEGFERCEALLALGFEHGFGTRTADETAAAPFAHVRQVHGDRMLDAAAASTASEADALLARTPGTAVAVWTADCVPILLVDPRTRGVAAIHAGWRGSALEIARKSAQAFAAALGADPAELIGVIGPHIGPCCYEVDAPVRESIAQTRAFAPGVLPGRWQLDLHAVNRAQLLAAGLSPERVLRCGSCTACDPTRYYSYRRDGRTGRLLHYVRVPGSVLAQGRQDAQGSA